MFHFTVEQLDGALRAHTPLRETVLIIVNVLNNTLFRREHLISFFPSPLLARRKILFSSPFSSIHFKIVQRVLRHAV